jgi:hypothetical protein
MSPQARQAIRNEAALTGRVVDYYRRMLGGVIERMNRTPAAPRSDIECMRMCVEAVDMMLENQNRIAQVLKDLSDEAKPVSDAA